MDRTIPILMIEDDMVDVLSIRRAFAAHHFTHPLFVVSDGKQALSFLNNEGAYMDPSRAPRPGIILLDLNLPVMGGIEFLRVVKGDPKLRNIPVIVFTSSNQESDVEATYALSVAGYIMKQPDFGNFRDTVKIIESYWKRCELP